MPNPIPTISASDVDKAAPTVSYWPRNIATGKNRAVDSGRTRLDRSTCKRAPRPLPLAQSFRSAALTPSWSAPSPDLPHRAERQAVRSEPPIVSAPCQIVAGRGSVDVAPVIAAYDR